MFNKKIVFAAACIGMLLFGIGLITLGSIAPDLKEKFSLNDVSAGALFAILPFGILAGSLVFGPVCDRYGYKFILVFACILMATGFEAIVIVSPLTLLKISIFVFGFAAGIINGATNAVVSDISKGSEGTNLSLLGVFFALGALGMPFIIGFLKDKLSSFQIISDIGWLTLMVGIFYSFISFPPSKKRFGFIAAEKTNLFKDKFLYLIAFYLFFDGSLESILNNWTTLYFTKHLSVIESKALYALSLYVAGMAVMRLLIGSVFRKVDPKKLFLSSLFITLAGFLIINFTQSYFLAVVGMILNGIGLAAAYPLMLGVAGSRYSSRSGTAFSFIFTISLLGNMLINYLMGIVSNKYGIQHYTTFAFVEIAFLVVLCLMIFNSKKRTTVEKIEAATPV